MSRERLAQRRLSETVESEQHGMVLLGGFSRFNDGRLAELFLSAGKPGSAADIIASDAAVILSIALQYGAPLDVIRHALQKLPNGKAAGPIGHLLDLIEGGLDG